MFKVSVLIVSLALLSIVVKAAPYPDDQNENMSASLSELDSNQRRMVNYLADYLDESPEKVIEDLTLIKLAKQLMNKKKLTASKRGHIWKRSVRQAQVK